MPGHSHAAWLARMPILLVASFLSAKVPTIFTQEPPHLTELQPTVLIVPFRLYDRNGGAPVRSLQAFRAS